MENQKLKHVHYLTIGGTEHPLQYKLKHIDHFFKQMNKLIHRFELKESDSLRIRELKLRAVKTLETILVGKLIYKCMMRTKKLGFFHVKPFFSYRKMLNSMLYEELAPFAQFVATMLNGPAAAEAPGDKKKGQI